jgi:hypothetical protein
LQQSQVHLQFGQSLQQSFEQQVPVLQVAAPSVREADCPAKLAAIKPAATTKPPNNLTNIENSLSLDDEVTDLGYKNLNRNVNQSDDSRLIQMIQEQ